jgi:hypothetical protein
MIKDLGEKTSLLSAIQGLLLVQTVHASSMAQLVAPDFTYIDF